MTSSVESQIGNTKIREEKRNESYNPASTKE
jgi:hypothetical protein